ncbi:C40 family peptidase [Patescibacteria group bacterium]|nr:C40 family peptidase [Patescibacteria group bacterium]MBU1501034.1 C40 family peptidase [Patescibacteria group bacterium]MBU2080664.1 C40 family peptidase [Patescibacteria group bacterium]MBU2124261.1 C40 family peptidase [Patescibacteria group bacterium]MBU2194387.1 C40 family peptidase [Patescibacteria group bacterium]
MQYRAVGKRCAIDLSDTGVSEQEAAEILERLGFIQIQVDLSVLARGRIGESIYHRGVSILEAPGVVDCSSLIKWLFAQKGIWLPRLCVQQYMYTESICVEQIQAGDVLYTSGVLNLYDQDPSHGVGHVGLATSETTVVHAVGKNRGVKEVSLERFYGARKLQGIRRFSKETTATFIVPESHIVEWSDDIKWLLLKHVSK